MNINPPLAPPRRGTMNKKPPLTPPRRGTKKFPLPFPEGKDEITDTPFRRMIIWINSSFI
jgi:hypothetical protein